MLFGVLAAMLVIGAGLTLLRLETRDTMSVAVPLAYGVIIVLGLLMLLNINPLVRVSELRVPLVASPHVNACVYGLLYGPVAFPCSGPLLVSIFALSFTITEFLGTLSLFLVFGLGLGVPLLALSLLAGTYQWRLVRLVAIYSRQVNALAGVGFLGIGVYGIWVNIPFLQIYCG